MLITTGGQLTQSRIKATTALRLKSHNWPLA
jgi:hypothetical protein